MAAEEFFNVFGSAILPALIFVAFTLAFLYLVYCEGKTIKTREESRGSRKEQTKS